MTKFRKLKAYVRIINEHRAINKRMVKESKVNFNKEVRGCIASSAFIHDLNKLFTFKIFKLIDTHEELISTTTQKMCCYNQPFSHHDGWMYTTLAIETLRDTELFKYISKFNNTSFIASDDEVYEVINNIKMLCGMFGEDPRAFYLRNYNCFRFGNSSLARLVIEDELNIDFDDYYDRGTHALTVHDIFNKEHEHFNPGLAYHAFIVGLTQYGVNLYEVLGLRDTYQGINDKV